MRLDPTISVPAAELAAQLDQGLKLRDMQSATTDGLRALDSVKEQLGQIEKTVKDRQPAGAPEVQRAIAGHRREIETIERSLARPPDLPRYRSNPRLAERLGGLLSSIDGVNAAPTPYQREYFARLQGEFRETLAAVNDWISRSVPRLNDALRKHGAPVVVPGRAVEIAP